MLNDFANHDNDIARILIWPLLVFDLCLHDVVPGEVQTGQAPVFLQDMEKGFHLRRS